MAFEMNRSITIALLLLVGLITLDATAAKRPNVVILLADDLGSKGSWLVRRASEDADLGQAGGEGESGSPTSTPGRQSVRRRGRPSLPGGNICERASMVSCRITSTTCIY